MITHSARLIEHLAGLQPSLLDRRRSPASTVFYEHVLSKDALTNDRLCPYLDSLVTAGIVFNQQGRRYSDEAKDKVGPRRSVASKTGGRFSALACRRGKCVRIMRYRDPRSTLPDALTCPRRSLHQTCSVDFSMGSNVTPPEALVENA